MTKRAGGTASGRAVGTGDGAVVGGIVGTGGAVGITVGTVVAVGARVGGGVAASDADMSDSGAAGDAARISEADDICAGGAPQLAMSTPISITNIHRITCVMQSSPLASLNIKFLYDLCVWYDADVALLAPPWCDHHLTAEIILERREKPLNSDVSANFWIRSCRAG
jgi:hypothetical protein